MTRYYRIYFALPTDDAYSRSADVVEATSAPRAVAVWRQSGSGSRWRDGLEAFAQRVGVEGPDIDAAACRAAGVLS